MSNNLLIAMNDFRNKYPRVFRTRNDNNIFCLTSVNFLFFENEAKEEELNDLDVDGTNDGGIDALFIDEKSDNNDIIYLQAKYCKEMSNEEIINAFDKMYRSYLNLLNRKTSSFKPKLNQCYLDCREFTNDESEERFILVTSFKPNITLKKKVLKSINSLKDRYKKEFEIYYGDDIEEKIESISTPEMTVAKGKLKIDDSSNFLMNNESIIVNISAESLKDLYLLWGNKLLNLNLRFFTINKNIDKAITKTIINSNNDFWYFNNGITIVCDDFTIEGKELKLINFSIINGGQTTNLISKKDFKDFYLICKIIKVGNIYDEIIKAEFISKICESSNQQKPIKARDIISNRQEQLQLQLHLQKLRPNPIYMIIKRGENFKDKKGIFEWQRTTNEEVGQLLLSCIFQQPGTARNNKSQIWNSLYNMIFKTEWNNELIKDLLFLSNMYSEFRKKYNNKLEINQEGVLKNGLYFTLATFILLKKINNNENILKEIKLNDGHFDNIKAIISYKVSNKIIFYTKDDIENKLLNIYFIINKFIADRYALAKEACEKDNKDYPPSNFTKLDNNYYKYIVSYIQRLYADIKEDLDEIFKNTELLYCM